MGHMPDCTFENALLDAWLHKGENRYVAVLRFCVPEMLDVE